MANQPAASSCTIGQQRIGQIEVLCVAGVVDMLTAPRLQEAIAAAAKDSPQGVIVDLGAVDFLASAKHLTKHQAYQVVSIAGNVTITQLVDKPNVGVHVRMPKSIFK